MILRYYGETRAGELPHRCITGLSGIYEAFYFSYFKGITTPMKYEKFCI